MEVFHLSVWICFAMSLAKFFSEMLGNNSNLVRMYVFLIHIKMGMVSKLSVQDDDDRLKAL